VENCLSKVKNLAPPGLRREAGLDYRLSMEILVIASLLDIAFATQHPPTMLAIGVCSKSMNNGVEKQVFNYQSLQCQSIYSEKL
jgi:hypothetical protein